MRRYLLAGVLLCAARAADPKCDLAGYQPSPGPTASLRGDALKVLWQGEGDEQLWVTFAVSNGQPVIRELSVRKGAGAWATLGRDLSPEFEVTTGKRRISVESEKWNAFWDAPLEIPGAKGTNPGLPPQTEEIRFTADRGTNLLRQEAIAKTNEPSVAYNYNAGLRGFDARESRAKWQDVARAWQQYGFGGAVNRDPVALRARNRAPSRA